MKKIKILKLANALLYANEEHLSHIRILLINNAYILRAYKGHFSIEHFAKPFSKLKNLNRIDRGKILEQFARIEFLLTELLHLVLLGYGNEKSYILDNIIYKTTLGRLINILTDSRILTKSLKRKMDPLTNVRNRLAHSWSVDDVLYKNEYMNKKTVLKKFKNDFIEAWSELKAIYEEEQNKIDVDTIIKSISSETNKPLHETFPLFLQ